jgi:Leucine-rich repeat (LRR) protein
MLDEALRRIQEAKRTKQVALDLSDLDLTEFPEGVCELTWLTGLDLYSNRLSSLPESIGGLRAVTILNLSGNRLASLPESFGRLASLTELRLSSNELVELPESFRNLTSLIKLDLSYNDFEYLPESMATLIALTELELSDNRLRAVPEWIGVLTALDRLALGDNRLTTLPESIGRLVALTNLDLSANRLTRLPNSIGDLRRLSSLNCSDNDLNEVPDFIGRLTALAELDLGRNDLRTLPDSISGLTNLSILDMRSNRLSALPESIGALSSLTNIDLNENRLTTLPDSICDLIALERLDVQGNRLIALPEDIGRLSALEALALRRNNIRTLPESFGRLTSLTEFEIWSNDLEDLPEWIGNLTGLTELNLGFNRLAALPESLGNLTALTKLACYRNNLSALPESIVKLTALILLDLRYNQLTVLPEAIGDFTSLTDLRLVDNRFTSLPEAIGNLSALTRLSVSDNHLSSVPASLSSIPGLAELDIDRNPLAPEIAAAYEEGLPGLMTFLNEVATDGVTVREAKLVFVGEGAVGKSTLLSAMLGEPFEAERSSTHGIEVRPLVIDQGTEAECVLNAWDFGGQPTYRPTHQLFFTAPAVYLVVWNPRHGTKQDNVEEWIELIRRRAGDEVRIHVVATHGGPKDRFAHIDETGLRQAHGDAIVGFHHVDSRTGEGIEGLRAAVQATASGLPHFMRKLPASWRRFQDDLHRTSEPYLEYRDYLARAGMRGLSEASANTLATVATHLGHWCYYPNIPGLDQLVVLKGDWLSAAVSLVIDDPETAQNHGLVEHSRLKRIWDDPNRPPQLRYPERVHRVLLRLMEEYEISYRVGGGGHGGRPPTSLIAQLVDSGTPTLEAWEDFGRHLPVQTRICKFSDASENFHIPEGLIYRLIVRLQQFSLGREQYEHSLHWTGGLVIDNGLHGRALIRLEGKQLTVSVKAVAPEYFLTMILEEVRSHVGEFWQGVKVHNIVTCGGYCNDPDGTWRGQWEVERLFKRRLRGKHEITCNSCDEDVSIRDLLSGVTEPSASEDQLAKVIESVTDPDFEALVDQLNGARAEDGGLDQDEVTRLLSRSESGIQIFLKALGDEAANGPRLFTIETIEQRQSASSATSTRYQVVLWCEYSRKPLRDLNDDIASGVFRVDLPTAWILSAGKWISAMAILLAAVQIPESPGSQHFVRRSFRQPVIIEPYSEGLQNEVRARSGETVADQLRELHRFIRGQDPTFGGLVRVRTRGGYTWAHPQFEPELNPGLPDMGGE